MTRLAFSSAASGFLALVLAAGASADTLVGVHSGAADPVTEGWVQDLAGPGTSSGPADDGGTAAWVITDGSQAGGSANWYRWTPDPAHLAAALSSGWRVRAVLRVTNANGAGETQFFGFLTGSVAFQVHLKAEAGGDVTARLLEGYPPFSGPTFTAVGGGYHTFELVSDGASGTASFLIDGSTVHTGYDGLPFGSAGGGARFGCGTSEATGVVFVSSVEFSIASDAVSVGAPEDLAWSRVKGLHR
ncbi:MAG: hypothetical protein R3B81_14540 [bacterium]